jgi:energy-coupling factor transporter ATP-binding protein EcfA2
MTSRIVVIVCGIAITVAALVALNWQRVQPTAGELQARDVSAAAQAAVDVAAARARAGELPARELALTLGLWAVMLSGAIITIGGGLAVVRAAHVRAGFAAVNLQHPVGLVGPGGVVILSGNRAEPTPQAIVATPSAPMIAAPSQSCPSWAALRWQPAPNRILLGWADGGPVVGALSDLLSVGVVGRSGSGKSTLLRMIVLQALSCGADVRVLDPHGSITDDLPGLPVADTIGAIEGAAGAILAELDRRIAMRSRHDRPVLLVADEFPAWAGGAPVAQAALRRTILEGRKFGLFAYISGQGLPAALFASGTMARDALSSRYVFASSPQIARQIGLEADMARQAPGLAVGRAILDGRPAGTSGARVIEVPYCDVTDLRAVLPGSARGLEGAGSGTSTLPGSGTITDAAQRVRAGASMTAALRDTFGVTGGRRYQELAAELRQALGIVGQP